jgi:hypothetical protein
MIDYTRKVAPEDNKRLLLDRKFLPASTAVPMHERTPERKELKGNDPTNPMYATCFSHTKTAWW